MTLSLINFNAQGHRLAEAGSRSIHSERSLHFMSHVIHADPEVLDILENGLKLQLIREPQRLPPRTTAQQKTIWASFDFRFRNGKLMGFSKDVVTNHVM